MKIEINVAQYATDYKSDYKQVDQTEIRVSVYDSETDLIGTGWIDNPFPQDYFGTSDLDFSRQSFSGVIHKTQVMEHANCGRSNKKVYENLAEYLADPIVKDACRCVITGGVMVKIARNGGDPDRVDYITTFSFDEYPHQEFTVTNSSYDSIVPQEWLNEFNSDTIIGLSKCGVWPDATSAIQNTESNDDLFGERYFPVLKAPKELSSLMQDICYGFKSYSEPLTDDEFVYIGIRSKSYEIGTIEKIYESGGWILQFQEWDW